MKIAVMANKELKEELLSQGMQSEATVEWREELAPLDGATAYIDLLFENTPERISALKKMLPATIIVNAVTATDLPGDFIRINGWPTFLSRPVTEASCGNEALKQQAEKIFSIFNKKVSWAPDVPGFISARVISMIINEAYHALEDEVSDKAAIDTAMKLGTNYPHGPFEWAMKIGPKNITALLDKLAHTHNRYTAASLLKKDAL